MQINKLLRIVHKLVKAV